MQYRERKETYYNEYRRIKGEVTEIDGRRIIEGCQELSWEPSDNRVEENKVAPRGNGHCGKCKGGGFLYWKNCSKCNYTGVCTHCYGTGYDRFGCPCSECASNKGKNYRFYLFKIWADRQVRGDCPDSAQGEEQVPVPGLNKETQPTAYEYLDPLVDFRRKKLTDLWDAIGTVEVVDGRRIIDGCTRAPCFENNPEKYPENEYINRGDGLCSGCKGQGFLKVDECYSCQATGVCNWCSGTGYDRGVHCYNCENNAPQISQILAKRKEIRLARERSKSSG